MLTATGKRDAEGRERGHAVTWAVVQHTEVMVEEVRVDVEKERETSKCRRKNMFRLQPYPKETRKVAS